MRNLKAYLRAIRTMIRNWWQSNPLDVVAHVPPVAPYAPTPPVSSPPKMATAPPPPTLWAPPIQRTGQPRPNQLEVQTASEILVIARAILDQPDRPVASEPVGWHANLSSDYRGVVIFSYNGDEDVSMIFHAIFVHIGRFRLRGERKGGNTIHFTSL